LAALGFQNPEHYFCRVSVNSERSRSSTPPTDSRESFTLSVLRVLGAGHERQSKPADLHLVAVRQHSRVHGFTVDVSAVEAADVDNLEFAAYALELGVPAADGDVVAEDIAVRVTTDRSGDQVKQEPRCGVRAVCTAPCAQIGV
jgi:hypothetical protein